MVFPGTFFFPPLRRRAVFTHSFSGRLFLTVLLPLLCLPLMVLAQESTEAVVKKVVIVGNRLIETETIKSRLQTEEGDVFDPEIISEDIRSVYSLGYFEDIQVSTAGFEGGLAVTFSIKEKPIITSIEFRGNKETKAADLRNNTGIKTNSVVDEYEIKLSIERIIAFLHSKGLYQASVDYSLEHVSENEMRLVYLVTEGESLWIESIDIQGNEAFSDREVKKVMKTKEKGFFSFVTHSGTLLAQQLEEDVLRILAFLYNNGHLKAVVDDPRIEVDKDKKEINVTIILNEGLRYLVGELTAPSDEYFTSQEITGILKTRPGEVFKRDVFARDISAVTELYTNLGFAFCRVDPRTILDDEEQVINLQLVINRGPKVKIGRIMITGNINTRDNVIRRQLVVKEGEYFSSKALARSRQKIMNLGFFESVDVTTEPRGEDAIAINIKVVERLTGNLSFGVGYSSEDKLGGIFRVTKENLFGRGHKLQASVQYSSVKQEYDIYFFNPAVWDSPYSFGFKVYDFTRDYTQYQRDSTGGSITVGRSLSEYFRSLLTLKSENVNITDVEEGTSNIIKEQEGISLTRSLTLNLTRDSRNNYFNPSRGSNIQLRYEYAGGFMGGDNDFNKYEMEAIFYFPLFWKLVLSLHGEGGLIEGQHGSSVPIYERFFLGGINTVRGFASRSIGPKDENGDPIGGHTKTVFNTEIIFPIAEEQRLLGVLFFDAGQAFGEDESIDLGTLRTSVGAGIRWFSPIGPFRIEWGYILDPEPGERRSDWQFSIGTAF